MNILIPHNWLTQHLKTDASPQDIQRMLSLCGPSVERIEEKEGESVYDIEVTTNRVDSFSVRGIAQEAAVILPRFDVVAQLIELDLPEIKAGNSLDLPQFHNDPALNRRTMMVVLDAVEHTPTPDWMAKRLRQIDQQVHDSVVDITNYVTHELGHTCHAFDYDKIMSLGGEITVKEAEEGQAFTTLDGQQYICQGGEVVFVNPAGEIIDLPGIMGTANTAVDDNTSRILLFIESIQPEKIRFASMAHAIRTQAAQINEKNADPHQAEHVLASAVNLYSKLTGAQVASAVYDDFPAKTSPDVIQLSLEEVANYLGLDISTEKIEGILSSLGCHVKQNSNYLQATPPTYRPDLTIPADLIEEVARIYGYHNLPSTLMDTPIPTNYPDNTNFPLEEQVQQLLADLGYQELYTYSMVSEELARQVDPQLSTTLKLKNPLTSDMTYLRRSILPSHVEAMGQSLKLTKLRGTFELANVYWKQGDQLPDEHLVLAVMDQDIRHLRTSLETLLHRLHIVGAKVELSEDNPEKAQYNNPFIGSYSSITHDGRVLGTLGYLPDGLVGAQLEWRQLLRSARKNPRYQTIPKTAPYLEDITVTIASGQPVGPVMDSMRQADERIRQVSLIDTYQDRWTFRLQYWDFQQQISASVAQQIHEKVIKATADL